MGAFYLVSYPIAFIGSICLHSVRYSSCVFRAFVINVSPFLQLKDLQDKYSECEDMLHEAHQDIKNLRNKSLPNSTVQRYTALTSVLPMDSLAAEIEGTFRKGLDNPAPLEYKSVSYVCHNPNPMCGIGI